MRSKHLGYCEWKVCAGMHAQMCKMCVCKMRVCKTGVCKTGVCKTGVSEVPILKVALSKVWTRWRLRMEV